ncbi:MAG: hypothetical protein K0U37_04525 [Gammaproteobacteria bacterium]|nr:hypothetical protein [Gammaproteobacteria bacterium]
MFTSNIGGCVAVITYNPNNNQVSMAHLMISETELQQYKAWFDEQEIGTDGMVLALVGGCNEPLPGRSIESSRALVSELRTFFDEKNISIDYEDLYAEEGFRNNRTASIHHGVLEIDTEVFEVHGYDRLEKKHHEVDLNGLSSQAKLVQSKSTPIEGPNMTHSYSNEVKQLRGGTDIPNEEHDEEPKHP